jgi:hypothetical protein
MHGCIHARGIERSWSDWLLYIYVNFASTVVQLSVLVFITDWSSLRFCSSPYRALLIFFSELGLNDLYLILYHHKCSCNSGKKRSGYIGLMINLCRCRQLLLLGCKKCVWVLNELKKFHVVLFCIPSSISFLSLINLCAYSHLKWIYLL